MDGGEIYNTALLGKWHLGYAQKKMKYPVFTAD
jgi:arylsulfatase A-like enzyme